MSSLRRDNFRQIQLWRDHCFEVFIVLMHIISINSSLFYQIEIMGAPLVFAMECNILEMTALGYMLSVIQ